MAPAKDLPKALRVRNLTILVVLVALAVLLYALTILRIEG